MPEISLPYQFEPRSYQRPVFEAYERGYRRFITCWHRKAGKDVAGWNFLIMRAAEVPGLYWECFPTIEQGKRVIWDGFSVATRFDEKENPIAGIHFRDHIPPELIASTNNQDHKIELKNGSVIQIVGSDNIEGLRGPNPIGVIMSEYSIQFPNVWAEVISPVLEQNKGWVWFNFTPQGRNHAFDLWQNALRFKETWFTDIRTINDTCLDDGSPIMTRADTDRLIAQGQDPDTIEQEYYCSFYGSYAGAYYAKIIAELRKSNHVREVPYDPSLPVFTIWDLGVGDANSIWFVQSVGREYHVIDYLESSGQGLPFYAKEVRNRPYVYSSHYGPHDIEVREYGTGQTRKEAARELGINFFVVPKLSIDDGIDAVRRILPRCYFDRVKCDQGLKALENYARMQKKDGTYENHPKHNRYSHGADAFRGFAVIAERESSAYISATRLETDFKLFD